MSLAFLRHQSLSNHLAMAGLSLLVVAALLLLIAFFPSGLQWWLVAGWQTGIAGHALLVSLVACFVLAVLMGVLRFLVVSTQAAAVVMFATVVMLFSLLMFGDQLVNSRIDNIGPLTLDRIQSVHAALEKEEHAVAALSPGAKPPAGVLDDMVEFRMALEVGTHASLRAAHARLVDVIRKERLDRAFNAAAILGLSKHPSVQAARVRTWMRHDEFKQLQDAARDMASKKNAAARFTQLQTLAYLALVEPDGLKSDLDYDPNAPAPNAKETTP